MSMEAVGKLDRGMEPPIELCLPATSLGWQVSDFASHATESASQAGTDHGCRSDRSHLYKTRSDMEH